MAMPYITIGCPTTGGGKVLTGNSLFQVEGIPIACTGDKASCPTHKVVANIISGDPHMNIFGKLAARAGDSLSCGCKLLPKQNLVVQDNSPSPSSSTSTSNPPPKQDNFVPQNTDDHGIKFKLFDERTGEPLVEQYFKIKSPDGNVIEGFTDETGHTELVESGKEAKEVDLITFDLSKPLPEWS